MESEQMQEMGKLMPPEEFPFPFQAYDIQKDFMKQLYTTLEQGAVGIFESPTGTVSSQDSVYVQWYFMRYTKRASP